MEKLRGQVGSCQTRDSAFNLRSEDSSAEDQQIPVYVRISLVRAQNFWDFELSTIGDLAFHGRREFSNVTAPELFRAGSSLGTAGASQIISTRHKLFQEDGACLGPQR